MKLLLQFNLYILLSFEAGLATMETKRSSRRGFKLSKEDLELYTSNHHSIEDYDITTPVYVEPKPIINKRSVGSELVTPQEREVKFNAFGQQYHARLQPNHWLLRQGLIVERVGSDGAITEEEISGRDCYYFAHLISHMGESAGALSTCNGLRGLISHDDTDVYITPLKDHHAFRYRRETQDEFNGEQPHIVYKRTSRRSQQTSDTLSSASTSYDYDDEGDDYDDDSDGKDIYYTYDETSDFDGNDTYSNDTFCEEVYAPEYTEEPDLYLPHFSSRDQGSREGGNVSHPGPIFADRMAAGQEEGEHLQEGGQRYLEVFVVVDDEMVRVHQEDVMNYTLAIMNMVSRRYIDPSLKSEIRMAIVKIVVSETNNLTMTGQDGNSHTLMLHANGNTFVGELCSWQKYINPSSDDDPLHFDNTILLTRRDLYLLKGTHKNTGLLGRAPVGTICRIDMSCSINEEGGLDASLTIAHELGHNLNLNHDPNYGCVNGRNIMSSTKAIGAASFKWSSCSADNLAKFFKSPSTNCLLDRPSLDHPDVELIPIDHLAGSQYTRLQQCRKVFGNRVIGICPLGRPYVTCGQVPCRIGGYCHYTGVVEGTACGKNMWCYDGFCRSSIGGVPSPVDGDWGEWPVDYTQCSRTCGSGVKYRQRKCNNPGPRFGGKACEGPMYSMKTCNKKPCAGINSSDDFRDYECALTNPTKLRDRYHEWSGDLDGTLYGDLLCDLKCKSTLGNILIRDPRQVSDGTRCWVDKVPDELRRTRRCVKKECKEFGCDGVYGSGKLLDGCGICEGSGRTCRLVQGNLRETIPKNTFWPWITVPIGATMVNITNMDGRNTAFGLQVDGKILFRPRFRNSRYRTNGLDPQRFTVGNIHILLRLEHYKWSQIWILSGPTTKPIQIEIMDERYGRQSEWNLRENPTSYEWYEPISDPVSYYWELNPLTECSVSCGGGNQTVMPICMEEINEMRVNVSDQSCLEQSPKPSHINECNTQLCPGALWLIGNWSQCSVTCNNGINERFVECIEGSTGEVIPPIECVITEGYTPMNNTMPCSQPACPTTLSAFTTTAEEEANDAHTNEHNLSLLLSLIIGVSVKEVFCNRLNA